MEAPAVRPRLRSRTFPSRRSTSSLGSSSFLGSTEPLVSLSDTVVECTGGARSPLDCSPIPQASSVQTASGLSSPLLTPFSSSTIFKLHTFPSSQQARPRTHFEELFDIYPDTPPAQNTNTFHSTFVLDDSNDSPNATALRAASTPSPLTFSLPSTNTLAMNLRKYATNESERSANSSSPSKWFHFGRKQHAEDSVDS
ncbi:hypothetical protein EC988_003800, partial [Linderina pennispora]